MKKHKQETFEMWNKLGVPLRKELSYQLQSSFSKKITQKLLKLLWEQTSEPLIEALVREVEDD